MLYSLLIHWIQVSNKNTYTILYLSSIDFVIINSVRPWVQRKLQFLATFYGIFGRNCVFFFRRKKGVLYGSSVENRISRKKTQNILTYKINSAGLTINLQWTMSEGIDQKYKMKYFAAVKIDEISTSLTI